MEALRSAARELAREAHEQDDSIAVEPDVGGLAPEPDLDSLWRNISLHNSGSHRLETCTNLLVAQSVLSAQTARELSNDDIEAANALYSWTAGNLLPSSEFTEALEAAYSADKEKQISLTEPLRRAQFTFSIGISVLNHLNRMLPIHRADNLIDIITALASFTSDRDPWTTRPVREKALSLLDLCIRSIGDENSSWLIMEDILKSRIKPVFAKTKNPSITPAGRKNFHPIPQPRFDGSFMDPDMKPWKFYDVYVTTVLEWILSRYHLSDCPNLEAHFPLLVPPILTLIDDGSLPFKARGCNLLHTLLIPLRAGGSGIIQRTNLSSVFEDAIGPCLLSIPTITPEDDSLLLLEAAYPALLLVLETRYQKAPLIAKGTSVLVSSVDRDSHIRRLANILRTNLISSYHHISSTAPMEASFITSFPYPRLSTFLLSQIRIILPGLGIHTTKHLQEIVPLLHTTLSNPFGTAYPPLLLAGISVSRAVILNAYPRIWRWRGELLGAFCHCWLHVLEDEDQISEQVSKLRTKVPVPDELERLASLKRLRKQLQGVVYLLKVAVTSIAQSNKVESSQENWAGLDADIDFEKELEELSSKEGKLSDLLCAELSPDDEWFS